MSGVIIEAAGSGLGVNLTHGPSGAKLETQPPKDNGGTGASFSPTDLVATALISCAITTMALAAGREGLQWGEADGKVEKRMTPPPRKIAELVAEFNLPRAFPAEHRQRYEEMAATCPVARSLSADVKLPMTFRWER
jgi:putative redox protein